MPLPYVRRLLVLAAAPLAFAAAAAPTSSLAHGGHDHYDVRKALDTPRAAGVALVFLPKTPNRADLAAWGEALAPAAAPGVDGRLHVVVVQPHRVGKRCAVPKALGLADADVHCDLKGHLNARAEVAKAPEAVTVKAWLWTGMGVPVASAAAFRAAWQAALDRRPELVLATPEGATGEVPAAEGRELLERAVRRDGKFRLVDAARGAELVTAFEDAQTRMTESTSPAEGARFLATVQPTDEPPGYRVPIVRLLGEPGTSAELRRTPEGWTGATLKTCRRFKKALQVAMWGLDTNLRRHPDGLALPSAK